MAQAVITLAKQETSDAILQKVTNIESKNNNIENLARGGV